MKSLNDILKIKNTYIFDMDGTLVDLEELNFNITAEVLLLNQNIKLAHEDYVKYFSGTHVGHAMEDFLKYLTVEFNQSDIEEMSEMFRQKKRFQLNHNLTKVVKVKPNAREFLELVKRLGFKVGLATSSIKEFALTIINGFDLNFFDSILTSEDITLGKPNPEVFNRSVEVLGSNKGASIIFEDSPNGIQAGLSSGMDVIAILNPGVNDLWAAKATNQTQHYSELINAIKNVV